MYFIIQSSDRKIKITFYDLTIKKIAIPDKITKIVSAVLSSLHVYFN